MNANNDYRIKSVTVSTNGRNELYFDVEWEGDDKLDYYELRVWKSDKDNCLEVSPYAAHSQRIIVKDSSFVKSLQSKQINKETFYVELGVADYTEEDTLKSWDVLAAYEPIEANIYYELHIFRKNVLELKI